MTTLISKTAQVFKAKFKSPEQVRFFQAPGRVNLIGEHTDYNDGFVLPAAIDRRIVLATAQRTDTRVNLYALDFDQSDQFDLEGEISRRSSNTWGNYIRGMASVLRSEGYRLTGIDAVVAGDIPIGAGLSSSAALEVAAGFGLLTLAREPVDLLNLARAAQKAENEFVGMHCGIMDQFIAALGQEGKALFIDCRDLSYRAVPLASSAAIVIVDSGVHRGLTQMAYNERRQECETAAKYFGSAALRDVEPETFEARGRGLSAVAARRAKHVISENARTRAAAKALESGDLAAFGDLMKASHASLRDDFEVSCPELDALVEIATGVEGVYGARLTGAGFGGCMVALVKEPAVAELIDHIRTDYPKACGRTADAYICRASAGVAEVTPDVGVK